MSISAMLGCRGSRIVIRRASCTEPRWFRGKVAGKLLYAAACFMLCAIAGGADEPENAPSPKKPAVQKPIPEKPKSTLEAAGLKIGGTGLLLPHDNDLNKMLLDATKEKKELIADERELRKSEAEIDEIKTQIAALKAKHVELSAGLANAGNAAQNNQLVGALNALAGQTDILNDRQKDATEKLKKARAKTSEMREAYVQHVLNMRSTADAVSEKWDKLAADTALQEAVTTINDATGKKLKLQPAPGFVTAEKKLQALEHTVLSESIPLSTDDGGLWVNVMIDGKHTRKMVVDSGSTTISLPFAMAKELGLEPTSRDEKIVVSLADGSEIPAAKKTIGMVRVGKFTVENVDCVVLDEKAIKAPALLGMSFLGQFKFEVDKQKEELRMVKIDTEDETAKAKPGRDAKLKKKKKETVE